MVSIEMNDTNLNVKNHVPTTRVKYVLNKNEKIESYRCLLFQYFLFKKWSLKLFNKNKYINNWLKSGLIDNRILSFCSSKTLFNINMNLIIYTKYCKNILSLLKGGIIHT
jgi:hypothetical protein